MIFAAYRRHSGTDSNPIECDSLKREFFPVYNIPIGIVTPSNRPNRFTFNRMNIFMESVFARIHWLFLVDAMMDPGCDFTLPGLEIKMISVSHPRSYRYSLRMVLAQHQVSAVSRVEPAAFLEQHIHGIILRWQ